MKVRTALSRPYPAGQTDNGQLFSKIWTAERHLRRFSGNSEQKRDKDRTRTVLSAVVWGKADERMKLFFVFINK